MKFFSIVYASPNLLSWKLQKIKYKIYGNEEKIRKKKASYLTMMTKKLIHQNKSWSEQTEIQQQTKVNIWIC